MPKLVAKPLTATSVAKIKSRPNRFDVFDGYTRGLGLRVAPSGTKTWFCMRRVNGRMVRTSLARYPEVDLAGARSRALKILDMMSSGTHPRTLKAESFRAVVGEWLKRDQANNRSYSSVEGAMELHVLPALGSYRVNQIKRGDLIRVIDSVKDRGAPIQANRVRAYLKRVFNWCMERDLIGANPASGLAGATREKSRDRVLSIDELRTLWAKAEQTAYPWGPLVRLLILTGQRLKEVAEAKWPEFDLPTGIWSLPGSRTKNSRAHLVHLPASSIEILNSLPRFQDCDFVFTTTATSPVSGFSKAKRALDKNSGLANWTFHDFRRSFATHLTEQLGVGPVVVDKILNHVSGAVKGVAAVYQRGEYLSDRKGAMEVWANFLIPASRQEPDAQRAGAPSQK